MSDEAYKAVKDEVSYEGWHFCTGQKSISVRRLEQIRRLYPTVEEVKGSDADSFQPKNNSGLNEVQQVCRDSALVDSSKSGALIDVSVLQILRNLSSSSGWRSGLTGLLSRNAESQRKFLPLCLTCLV